MDYAHLRLENPVNPTLEPVAFRAELWRKFVAGYLRTSWSALVGCAADSITPRTLPPVHPGWASAYCGVCGKRYDAVDKLTAVRILNLHMESVGHYWEMSGGHRMKARL
jgi:hypothetical protein